MIEAIEFTPRLRVMAGLAPGGLAIGGHFHHAILELAVMRILVTGLAGQSLEVIRNLRLRLIFVGELMTVTARNG